MQEYIPTSLREPEAIIREVRYAIGEEQAPNSFGMWKGPHPEEKEMLEVVGQSNKSCIIRFNKDGSDTVIWRWREYRWKRWNK